MRLYRKDNESITNYYDRAIGVANRMWIHGEVIEDTIIVLKILHSMAPKYNYVVCSIEESKNIDSLSLEELQSSLVVHEQKVNHGTVTNEQALKASHLLQSSNYRGRGRGRGGCSSRDGGRQNFKNDNDQSDVQGKGRGHDQQFDKSKVECFRCQQFGYHCSECYTKLPKDKEKSKKSHFVEKQEEETLLWLVMLKRRPRQTAATICVVISLFFSFK